MNGVNQFKGLLQWRRLWPSRRLLSLQWAAPLAVVLAILVVATTEAGHQAEQVVNLQRDTALDTRLAVSRIRSLTLQMESAKRGYMLTSQPGYRAPFDESSRAIAQLLAQLKEQVAHEPSRHATLGQLIEAVELKMTEMNDVLRLFDAGERQRAIDLILTDIGREQMVRINGLADATAQEMSGAYADATQRREQIKLWSRVVQYTLVLVSLAALWVLMRMSQDRERERLEYTRALAAERDKLEDTVALRTRGLSELARHLQSVREDERSRLARDLHDELGGLLTAAKLDVARVRKRLPGAGQEVVERIDHLAQTLDAGIALKRRIIEDLRPSSLAHFGLKRTLEIQCEDFARLSGVKVETAIADLELTDDRELAIYRFVQEALTNVAKYARARTVWITLEPMGSTAQIQVRDDGIGFDPERVRPDAHGLSGMRFRVNSHGGEWLVQSAPGQGTLLQARMPLKSAAEAAVPSSASV